MASTAAGDVVYAAWVPEGQVPSLADPLYLAFYPLVYAGIVLLMRERLRRVPTAFRLDALICGLTLGAVAAAVATGPINAAMQGEPATVFVGLAYPVGDLLLLALTAGMLPDPRLARRTAMGLSRRRFHGVRDRRHGLPLPDIGRHLSGGHLDRRLLADRLAPHRGSGLAAVARVPALVRNPVWRPIFRLSSAAESLWPWPCWPTRPGSRWRWRR